MRILHINSYYSSSRFYKNLYDEQIKNDLDIKVFIPTNKIDVDFDYGDYSLVSKNFNKFDRFFFHLKHHKILMDLQNKIKVETYDLIHAHSLFSNGFIAYQLKKKYNIPYIVSVRNTDINIFLKKMLHLRHLGIKILHNADTIIFLSNSYKDLVIDKYIPKKFVKEINDKSVIIPNGIDKFWFKNIGKKKKLNRNEPLKLIYIGEVNKNKNVVTTIRACELLIEQGFSIQYQIIGKIVDEKYRKLISQKEFIEYTPFSDKEKLVTFLSNSDIFVMPSKYETFGLVYAEAMSQGLPVIYTRGQGFDGQFSNGKIGYAVPYNSAEDISNKIKVIIKNYEIISKNCLEYVSRFNWKTISVEYTTIYNKLLLINYL